MRNSGRDPSQEELREAEYQSNGQRVLTALDTITGLSGDDVNAPEFNMQTAIESMQTICELTKGMRSVGPMTDGETRTRTKDIAPDEETRDRARNALPKLVQILSGSTNPQYQKLAYETLVHLTQLDFIGGIIGSNKALLDYEERTNTAPPDLFLEKRAKDAYPHSDQESLEKRQRLVDQLRKEREARQQAGAPQPPAPPSLDDNDPPNASNPDAYDRFQRETNTTQLRARIDRLASTDLDNYSIQDFERTYGDDFDGIQGDLLIITQLLAHTDGFYRDEILTSPSLRGALNRLANIANATNVPNIHAEVTTAIWALCALSPDLQGYTNWLTAPTPGQIDVGQRTRLRGGDPRQQGPSPVQPAPSTPEPATSPEVNRDTHELRNILGYIADVDGHSIQQVEETYNSLNGVGTWAREATTLLTRNHTVDTATILRNPNFKASIQVLLYTANHTVRREIHDQTVAALQQLCNLSPDYASYVDRLNVYDQEERDRQRRTQALANPHDPYYDVEPREPTPDEIELMTHIGEIADLYGGDFAAIEMNADNTYNGVRRNLQAIPRLLANGTIESRVIRDHAEEIQLDYAIDVLTHLANHSRVVSTDAQIALHALENLRNEQVDPDERLNIFNSTLNQIEAENKKHNHLKRLKQFRNASVWRLAGYGSVSLLEQVVKTELPWLHAAVQSGLGGVLKKPTIDELLDDLNAGEDRPYVLEDSTSVTPVRADLERPVLEQDKFEAYITAMQDQVATLRRWRKEGRMAQLDEADQKDFAETEAELVTLLTLAELRNESRQQDPVARTNQLEVALKNANRSIPRPQGTVRFDQLRMVVSGGLIGGLSGIALQGLHLPPAAAATVGYAAGHANTFVYPLLEQKVATAREANGGKTRFTDPILERIREAEARKQGIVEKNRPDLEAHERYNRLIPEGNNTPAHRVFRGIMLYNYPHLNPNTLVDYGPHSDLTDIIQQGRKGVNDESMWKSEEYKTVLQNELAFINTCEDLIAHAADAVKHVKRDVYYPHGQFVRVVLLGALVNGRESGYFSDLPPEDQAAINELNAIPQQVGESYSSLFSSDITAKEAVKGIEHLLTGEGARAVYSEIKYPTPSRFQEIKTRARDALPRRDRQEEGDNATPQDVLILGGAQPEEAKKPEEKEKKEKKEKSNKKEGPEKIGSAILRLDRFRMRGRQLFYIDVQGEDLEVTYLAGENDRGDAQQQEARWMDLKEIVQKQNVTEFEGWARMHSADIYLVPDPIDPEERNYAFRFKRRRHN